MATERQKEERPVVSVVVPLFNKEKYITRCLRSLAAQSFANFEVVVVNDGSTDGSAALAQDFGDPRVRLIAQENQGVSAARNHGIREARGEWVAFLDADDEYRIDFLARALEALSEYPEAEVAYCRILWSRFGVDVNPPADREARPRLLRDYLAFVVYRGGQEISSSSVIVRRGVFDRSGLFPEGTKIGEDSDLWLRIGWVSPVVYVPETLAVYHMDAGDSGWQSASADPPLWLLTYAQWRQQGLIPRELMRSADAYVQRYYLQRAFSLAVGGNWGLARRVLWANVHWGKVPVVVALRLLAAMLLGRRGLFARWLR